MKKLIPTLIVISIGITIGYFMIDKPKVLKIYNPADINPDLVDESLLKQNFEYKCPLGCCHTKVIKKRLII